jgi:hypothetical protein
LKFGSFSSSKNIVISTLLAKTNLPCLATWWKERINAFVDMHDRICGLQHGIQEVAEDKSTMHCLYNTYFFVKYMVVRNKKM